MVHLAIVGGGLVGCLAAVYLRRLGWDVTVVEKRQDLRTLTAETGRSINLIVTSRALHALRELGIVNEAVDLCVPVRGRMMHGMDKSLTYQPYGISLFEVNYSVSRTKLNCMLIDTAEKEGVRFLFNHEISDLDARGPTVEMTVTNNQTKTTAKHVFDFVVGTDGVGSATRRFMLQALRDEGVTAYDCIDRLGISYREVTFPPDAMGQYSMRADALHIWPRGACFLMALADKGPSFTGTLYLPDFTAEIKGLPAGASANRPPSFEELGNERAKIKAYLDRVYPDVADLVPDVLDQLTDGRRPHSFLATLRCTHWHYHGKIVLMGDAAHGVVPFFGQGMNLGFESVVMLMQQLKKHVGASPASVSDPQALQAALSKAFAGYQSEHQASAAAIANMAIENFSEMSFKVGLPAFLKTKKVENDLEARYAKAFRSRYYMVTKTLVPYRVVYRIGVLVDRCVQRVEALMQRTGAASVEALVAAGKEKELLEIIDATVTRYLKSIDVSIDQPLRPYYDRTFASWEVPLPAPSKM